jgi:hypothetical protein
MIPPLNLPNLSTRIARDWSFNVQVCRWAGMRGKEMEMMKALVFFWREHIHSGTPLDNNNNTKDF